MKSHIIQISLALIFVLSAVSCLEEDTESPQGDSDKTSSLRGVEEIFTNPEAIDAYLQDLAKTYEHVRYEKLGASEDGDFTIGKVIISDNVETEEAEPEVQICGSIHGDEIGSTYLSLKLLELLAKEYEANSEVSTLVESYEIHIIPVVNPWGLENSSRYNSMGVDLNRNFAWAWVDSYTHGDKAFDQAESLLIRDDAQKKSYNLSIAFHTGETCISTLWDYIGTVTSDGSPASYSYDTFASDYLPNSETIFAYAKKYETSVVENGDDEFYFTEGYDWYACFGTLGDWMYGELGAVAYTIEVSNYKSYASFYGLDEDEWYEELTSDIWTQHKDALLGLFSIFDTSISGTIIDSETKEPLSATVFFSKESRSAKDPVEYPLFSKTDPDFGDFHALCDAGSYSLYIEAEGYESLTLNGVTIGDALSIELVPSSK